MIRNASRLEIVDTSLHSSVLRLIPQPRIHLKPACEAMAVVDQTLWGNGYDLHLGED